MNAATIPPSAAAWTTVPRCGADVVAAVAVAALGGAHAGARGAEPPGVADRHLALAGERVDPAQPLRRGERAALLDARGLRALLAQDDCRVRDRRTGGVDDRPGDEAGPAQRELELEHGVGDLDDPIRGVDEAGRVDLDPPPAARHPGDREPALVVERGGARDVIEIHRHDPDRGPGWQRAVRDDVAAHRARGGEREIDRAVGLGLDLGDPDQRRHHRVAPRPQLVRTGQQIVERRDAVGPGDRGREHGPAAIGDRDLGAGHRRAVRDHAGRDPRAAREHDPRRWLAAAPAQLGREHVRRIEQQIGVAGRRLDPERAVGLAVREHLRPHPGRIARRDVHAGDRAAGGVDDPAGDRARRELRRRRARGPGRSGPRGRDHRHGGGSGTRAACRR